jgi:O-antigen ligase
VIASEASAISGVESGFPRKLGIAAAMLLAYTGLLPATMTPWVRVAGVPISTKDLALIAVSSIGLLYCFGRARVAWPWRIAKVTFGVFAYALLSMTWSGVSGRNVTAMAYTVVVSASAAAIGYAIAKTANAPTVERLLAVLTLALAGLTALYSAESMFDLGLRSAADKNWTDFGIQRVRGPLFGSSTGGFVLLPALAFALEQLLRAARARPIWGAASLSLLVGLFGLGSRSALLALALFVLLTTLLLKSAWSRLVLSLLVLVLAGSAGAFVFSRATLERLVTAEDPARQATHEGAARIVSERDALEQLVGSGYGRYWPWYLTDVETPNLFESGAIMQSTPMGEMLYHPHSTVLLLGVEMGAIGTAFLLVLLLACVSAVRRARRAGAWIILWNGLLGSLLLMEFDLLVFKNAAVNACWWVYAFGAMRLAGHAAPSRGANSSPEQPVLIESA